MNKTLFAVIAVLTVISILLVLIFKQPYKKINLEQMQQGNFKIDEGAGGEAGSDAGTVNGNDVVGGTAGKTDFNNDEEDEDTISYT